MAATDSVPGSPQMYDFDREDLIDIFFDKPKGKHPHGPPKPDEPFPEAVMKQSGNPFSYTPVWGADALRRLYPKHSLVMTHQGVILNYPGVSIQPLEKTPLITNSFFVPLSKRLAGVPGVLVDQLEFGALKVRWQSYEFLQYTVTYPGSFGPQQQHYILYEGPEEHIRLLLLTAGAWADELHEEIWVFDQGWWQKSHALWAEAQKGNWNDVILKPEFKKALQKDIYGFFDSEEVYKDLGIAWKRGLIMYGPPGNGKTISLKTIMKTCGEKGFQPLYVKSFHSWGGDEMGMADVFNKARQLSPCVIILEDLDSLITDENRSFFLNQVDGIEGNDGLLLIGTTNHFDRLDPGLSTRPSRFDRKFKFDDPDLDERTLYAQYWQKKLQGNKSIDFPDSLVHEIAEATDRFSFAYLKEAFVSTLVTLAGFEGDDKPTFSELIKAEIKTLRKQLDKSVGYDYLACKDASAAGQNSASSNTSASSGKPARPPRPNSSNERDIRAILDALSEHATSPIESRRFFRGATDYGRHHATGKHYPTEAGGHQRTPKERRDIRSLLDALAEHLEASDISSFRSYEYGASNNDDFGEAEDSRSYRRVLDRLTDRERDMRLFDLQQRRSGHQHRGGSGGRHGGMRGPSAFFEPSAEAWDRSRAYPMPSGSGAAFVPNQAAVLPEMNKLDLA